MYDCSGGIVRATPTPACDHANVRARGKRTKGTACGLRGRSVLGTILLCANTDTRHSRTWRVFARKHGLGVLARKCTLAAPPDAASALVLAFFDVSASTPAEAERPVEWHLLQLLSRAPYSTYSYCACSCAIVTVTLCSSVAPGATASAPSFAVLMNPRPSRRRHTRLLVPASSYPASQPAPAQIPSPATPSVLPPPTPHTPHASTWTPDSSAGARWRVKHDVLEMRTTCTPESPLSRSFSRRSMHTRLRRRGSARIPASAVRASWL
ncbi:hypothetical protein DFH09DRAFT_411806 [Mycena vulgaris]|nr:hypothetical protein DFH09DRAFT_411806 [Mycena vulgaris]